MQYSDDDGFGDPWIQWAMISDASRSNAYEQALKKLVNKQSVVLDLGSGTGLLSAYALLHGAKKVHAIEESGIAKIIKTNLKKLNLLSQLNEPKNFILHHNTSFNVDFAADINLVVSELFGNDPFQEGLFATLCDVAHRIKNKNVQFIPKKLEVYGEMITLLNHHTKPRIQMFQNVLAKTAAPSNSLSQSQSEFHNQFLNSIKESVKFDCVSFPMTLTKLDFVRASVPIELGSSELNPPPLKEAVFAKRFSGEKKIIIPRANNLIPRLDRGNHSSDPLVFIFWFRVYLTDDISISSHPQESDYACHWSPIAVVLNKHLKPGSEVNLKYRVVDSCDLFECEIFEKDKIIGARVAV